MSPKLRQLAPNPVPASVRYVLANSTPPSQNVSIQPDNTAIASDTGPSSKTAERLSILRKRSTYKPMSKTRKRRNVAKDAPTTRESSDSPVWQLER